MSAAEIALIKSCAQMADVGGYAVRDAIKAGTREIDVVIASDASVQSVCFAVLHVW